MKIYKDTRREDATPYASSLIEGLRDFGYTLETSLADIIDNSITAGADRVDLIADSVGPEPWIAVVDNGTGMTEAELIEAMRPGSQNPREARNASDLGRFGLGLKSASFAQCRALYVVTRKNGETSCAAWDLDEVSEVNRWELAMFDEPDFPAMDYLHGDGTAIIWQKLDRLDGGFENHTEDRAKTINASLAAAERHLRLVFHRFLEGVRPQLVLSINSRKLKPLDPFVSDNPARQSDPAEELKLAKGRLSRVARVRRSIPRRLRVSVITFILCACPPSHCQHNYHLSTRFAPKGPGAIQTNISSSLSILPYSW